MEDNKRNVGRPLKGAYKRSHKVTVAFNDYEYEAMLNFAELSGLCPADWCRKTALKTRPREALTAKERQQIKDLYKLGTNANQVRRLMQAKGDWRYDREIEQMLKDHKQIKDYFMEILSHGR